MRRLMVMAVLCVTLVGCAASQYKFVCNDGTCEVETSGPATLDFEREFGETLEVVETADDRVTLEAESDRKSFKMGESGTVGPLKVTVTNIKGELAVFSVKE
ncbi:hypothetical protein OJ997_20280 [Solirubrobacter phytolaccae]|uniref:Uncharacterized protein n=1 Tax=Solirubrobacter phytolaccae TaxID=1404360 RepID=A0A9X3SCL1_9ACTN|nr:hypothetical protein [Solirubrobacter phytolaccae]MDA0182660.1 hypothetical protein [Solirubrobacter phytolaccae]